jgi:hypothetical protein
MGKGKYPRSIPTQWQTVGAMAANGTDVRAWCRKCSLVLKVGCDGTVFFLANGRGRFESLLTDD